MKIKEEAIKLVIDTNVLVAILNTKDQYHRKIMNFIQKQETMLFIVPAVIFVEYNKTVGKKKRNKDP
jgi:predicted nucleic acid-binding protein